MRARSAGADEASALTAQRSQGVRFGDGFATGEQAQHLLFEFGGVALICFLAYVGFFSCWVVLAPKFRAPHLSIRPDQLTAQTSLGMAWVSHTGKCFRKRLQ